MSRYLAVALGGALGSLARYGMGSALIGRLGTRSRSRTLAINVIACAAIGFALTVLNVHAGVEPVWRLLVAVGFIGAFSTFSTLEWEVYSGLKVGAVLMTALYMAASIVLGLASVWLGALAASIS